MRSSHTSRLARSVLALALLPAAACGSGNTNDAGADATDESDAALDVVTPPMDAPTCPPHPPLMAGDPNGAPMPLRAPSGQARAGRLAASDIPADETGLNVSAAGDFVLANERVALVIENAGPSDGYDPWGGRPVAAARVREGRMVEPADFGEALAAFGRFMIATERVTVLRDGTMGGSAVVRAEGPMRAIPFLGDLVRGILPGDYTDLRGALDYELAPNSDTVTITAQIDSQRALPVRFSRILAGFFQGYRMPSYVPGVGVTNEMASMSMPYIAFSLEGRTGWAWQPSDGDLDAFIQTTGFDGFYMPTFAADACAVTAHPIARFTIGGPGLDGLLTAVASSRGEMSREVRGTVLDADGMPASGVHVHATRMNDVYETGASTDATGAFTLHVPAGAPVKLFAFRRGDTVVGPVAVGATEAMAAPMRLGPAGSIRVSVREPAAPAGMGRGLPVRVQVTPLAGTALPTVPATFGEFRYGNGRLHIDFPTNGETALRAPVGRYHVTVSRGFEYTVLERDVDVTANGTVSVEGTLEHVVDTRGSLCGDFHIHTHRSPDSDDTARGKLAAIAGDGVDLAVRSDHEFVADFEPFVEDMGLRPWLRAVPSLELTTFAWGHFGVVPVVPNPAMPNAGAFEWAGRLPPAVFDDVRAREGSPVLIINHPRSGGAIGAYFTAAGWDPATNTASRPTYWDTQFSAVEFFNDSSFEENRDGTVKDWFGLLRAGRRVFAVGSSDSHHVLTSGPVGYPRTCLFMGVDEPAMVTNNGVRDALGRGRSTVFGGVYVTAEAMNNTGPGGDVAGAGATATVRVTVQAPPWIRPERLEVIVDGATTQTIAIPATGPDASTPSLRLRQDVMVPVAATGSYVIFVAHGAGDLAPVYPGRKPFGVTNPIFFRR